MTSLFLENILAAGSRSGAAGSAQLSSAQLSSAQLSSAQLSSAQLSSAQLSSAQLSSEESLLILQREVGFTSADSGIPILASCGAGSCVIMAVYNPETKQVALAHVDDGNDVGSIHQMLWYLKSEGSELLVYLAQENKENQGAVKSIVTSVVSGTPFCRLVTDDIKSHSLAIDARGGGLFCNFNHKSLKPAHKVDIYTESYARMLDLGAFAKESLLTVFNGTNSTGRKANLWVALNHAAIPRYPNTPVAEQYKKINDFLKSTEVELPRDKAMLEQEFRALADIVETKDAPKIREIVSSFSLGK